MVSLIARLPPELRIQIYEIVLSLEICSPSIVQIGQRTCACPRGWSRLRAVVHGFLDTCARKRGWRSYHISPRNRPLSLGMMTVDRATWQEFRAVLFRMHEVRLTWDETVQFLQDPSAIDLVVTMVIYERPSSHAHHPLSRLSQLSRLDLLGRVLHGQRLQSLIIDLEPFCRGASSTSFGIYAFQESFLLTTMEWDCISLGCYRFRANGVLRKLTLQHGLLLGLWGEVASLDSSVLRTMAMLDRGNAFLPSKRRHWTFKFPPFCQRVVLRCFAWLSALRVYIEHVQRQHAQQSYLESQMWPGWEDVDIAEMMPGTCIRLNHRWTDQLAKVFENNRRDLEYHETNRAS